MKISCLTISLVERVYFLSKLKISTEFQINHKILNFEKKNRNFLEELCLILYDRLRPIIIHVIHIETLAELCSILKTEILMDNLNKNCKLI